MTGRDADGERQQQMRANNGNFHRQHFDSRSTAAFGSESQPANLDTVLRQMVSTKKLSSPFSGVMSVIGILRQLARR